MAARGDGEDSCFNRSVSSLIAIIIDKCQHTDRKISMIKSVCHMATVYEIFCKCHGEKESKDCDFEARCLTNLPDDSSSTDNTGYLLENGLTIGDIKCVYPEIRALHLKCKSTDDHDRETCSATTSEAKAAATTVNAFNIMMSGEKVHIRKKESSNNRKDELFNDIVDLMMKRDLKIHRASVADEGSYITQVLTNALWYLTNQHVTINDAAKRFKDVLPVPAEFDTFQGYNDIKRKKLKSQSIDKLQCQSHAEALFSLCSRPTFKSSVPWCNFKIVVEDLAKCFANYSEYLEKQQNGQETRQAALRPTRTVLEDISVDFHAGCPFIKDKYKLFDNDVSKADFLVPVLFEEEKHLEKPFDNSIQKLRFFENIQLTKSIDLFCYCPGGGISSIFFAAKVRDHRSENETHVEPLRVVAQIHERLPEYHTRAMKQEFKQKLGLITSVKPAIADFVYKTLALDSSQVTNPEMQQRLKIISLGEICLVADLRELNPGKPNDKFDVFFNKLQEKVENVTAADERRHGVAHLSSWISLNELIEQTANECPEGTLIPSKSLVRLQFTPRNVYTHSALNFTQRIPVQYKIQKRQLRADHPDQHYCAAQFKYLKSKAVEMGPNAVMVCCDDKAKVPIGDPGLPVSTGVRGKKSIAPVGQTLAASDHDMTKSSLCPSVYLVCETPQTVEGSFVNGQVHVTVNDSVMQTSNPFRHAAALCTILKQNVHLPKVLLKFSDGGTDQRNTLEAVKCATICVFKELNFDMIVLARCAPGNSWVNPAERVMSILNLGLQNCALERLPDNEKFKSCSSMSQIRESISKHPELEETWQSSIGPVKKIVEERFQRLKLKDNPIKTFKPVADADIDILQRHLRELFPDLDLAKLQKAHTKKCESYQKFLNDHCQQRHYNFQVRKCADPTCCLAPTTPTEDLAWLPDPIMEDDQLHYKKYIELKGSATTEDARPSLRKPAEVTDKPRKKIPKQKTNLRSASVQSECNDQSGASVYTAQNARYTLECCECRKPRVLYSKNKLTDRQCATLAMSISETDYTCGSHVGVLQSAVFVRLGLICSDIIELAYYSSNLGRRDLCCFCGSVDAETSQELLKHYKTVLPICGDCSSAGFTAVCQQPYGKQK